MLEAVVFYTLATFILGLGILVITARTPVHSVLFLVLNFLLVAVLYVTLGAQFVAVIQVLVYAGGIVVLYLFVVMLVSLKRAPEEHGDNRRLNVLGALLGGAVLAELIAIIFASRRNNTVVNSTSDMPASLSDPMLNTEQLGWVLYTEYLIPFELASMLLLVAMIGAIVLAKKNI
tara:strand:- start:14620 stop:15144 length:525 start_codon:yes stop_codon:yes gene_type:complete